jgi:hypothetical protein
MTFAPVEIHCAELAINNALRLKTLKRRIAVPRKKGAHDDPAARSSVFPLPIGGA